MGCAALWRLLIRRRAKKYGVIGLFLHPANRDPKAGPVTLIFSAVGRPGCPGPTTPCRIPSFGGPATPRRIMSAILARVMICIQTPYWRSTPIRES